MSSIRPVLAGAACAAVLLVAADARADIVNVQSILSKEAEPGFSGSVTGKLDWRTGNTDLILVGVSPAARYKRGNHLVIAVGSGEYGKSGDTRIIAKTFEHLRYRLTFTDWLLGEVFVQHTFDDFRRLELRTLGGIGPSFTVVDEDKGSVDIGIAYMLEYERYSTDPMATDSGDDDLAPRISSYVMGTLALDDNLQLIQTIYAQPRLTDFTDFRLLNDTGLVVKINETLSFKTAFTLAWDTETPDLIEDLDTALKSEITVSF